MGIWEEGLAVVLTQQIHSYNYLSEDSSFNCHITVPQGSAQEEEGLSGRVAAGRQKPHHFSWDSQADAHDISMANLGLWLLSALQMGKMDNTSILKR